MKKLHWLNMPTFGKPYAAQDLCLIFGILYKYGICQFETIHFNNKQVAVGYYPSRNPDNKLGKK